MDIGGWFDDHLITIINGLAFGFLLYTISVGLSLILGMMNVLNLAHGTFYLFGAYMAWAVIGGESSWDLFLVAILIAVGCGLFLGGGLSVALAPLNRRGHSHMDQALLTLGLFFAGAQLIEMSFDAEPRTILAPPGLSESVDILGNPYPAYRLFLIGVGLVLATVITIVMERTPAGSVVKATVADPEMVRGVGIDTRKVVVVSLAIGSMLAVVGGVLGSPFLGAHPGLDGQVLLIALVIVVVGGLGSPRGALVGALIIGQVQVLGTELLPEFAPFLLLGAMAIVLVTRPQGVLGDVQLGH